MPQRDEPTSPTFWQLQIGGWFGLSAAVLVFAYTYIPHNSPGILQTVAWDLTTRLGIAFLATLALRPVCRFLLRRSLRWFYLELWVVVCSVLTAIPAAFLVELNLTHIEPWDRAELTRNSVRCCLLLFFWCNLYFSVKQWQRSAQERVRLVRAEADAREARLSALRYQLNPHFLFNSLNAVSTLVLEGDGSAASRMLAKIAELLRTTLDSQLPWEVPLSEEMIFTQRYLDIEQVRLGERLQIDLAIASDTLHAAVPSMLLQPLVENAIRHGVAPTVEGGSVAIQSKLQDSQLRIVITNSGSEVRSSKTNRGIGLTNTAERLRTLYGDDHKLNLRWPETGGCEVVIEIPFRRVSQEAGRAACAY